MILFYFISAIILSVATLLVNKRRTAQIMISLFAAIQIAFAYYAYLHLNQTDLSYFTYDPLGVIFLSVLSIIFPATIYHGFRYFIFPVDVFKKSAPPLMAHSQAFRIFETSVSSPVSKITFIFVSPQEAFI
jgi:heme/copper-type cytochrome/quinol oxidase subunit 4